MPTLQDMRMISFAGLMLDGGRDLIVSIILSLVLTYKQNVQD